MLHARHNDAPRRGQAGNADRTFDASKQSPSYYSLNTALLSLLQKQLTPFFYFLLSTLFNYTVRLMAPGMRVCKKKKITSARLNNYSPFFSTTTSHHHHQYITSNKKKRNKNETSRNPLRETEIKLLPLFLVTIFKPDLTNKSGFTNIAIYGSILYILEVASFLGTRLKIRLNLKINKSVETAGEVSCRVPCILSSFVENRTCSN